MEMPNRTKHRSLPKAHVVFTLVAHWCYHVSMDSAPPASSSRKDGYSIALIRKLLDNYAFLEQGRLPLMESGYAEYWGPKMTRRGRLRSPFETAAIMKCDIDLAIQQLPPALKFVILTVDIDGRSPSDCAYWLGKSSTDVMAMEDHAVKRMAGILSGDIEKRGGYRPGAGRKKATEKGE